MLILLQPTGSLYRRRFAALECNPLDQLTNTLLALHSGDALLESLELLEFIGHDFSGKVKVWEFRLWQSLLDGRVELGRVGGGQSDKGRRGGTAKQDVIASVTISFGVE